MRCAPGTVALVAIASALVAITPTRGLTLAELLARLANDPLAAELLADLRTRLCEALGDILDIDADFDALVEYLKEPADAAPAP